MHSNSSYPGWVEYISYYLFTHQRMKLCSRGIYRPLRVLCHTLNLPHIRQGSVARRNESLSGEMPQQLLIFKHKKYLFSELYSVAAAFLRNDVVFKYWIYPYEELRDAPNPKIKQTLHFPFRTRRRQTNAE